MPNTIIYQHKIDKYLSWFILKSIQGIGNVIYKRLIEQFGSPENVLKASRYDLMQIKGIGKKSLFEIINSTYKNSKLINELKNEIILIQKAGFKIITMNEENYPSLLRHIPDPPPYLTYIGSLDISSFLDNSSINKDSSSINKDNCLINKNSSSISSIAVVGSRDATDYGLNSAAKIAYDLSINGFEIVSGMALGIDAAAHKGALQAGGRTVAVLGSGLGKIYPSENKNLFYKIADNGAVISEFRVNAEPEGRNFPIRNRIIAGMTSGTVVVEAASKSGSLITARLAAEYNREVFAVPGDIYSTKSAGTHALLKQGAKLVENYIDVVEEIYHLMPLKSENSSNNQKSKTAGLDREIKSDSRSNILNDTNKSSNQYSNKSSNQYPNRQIHNKTDKISLPELDKYQVVILDIIKSSPVHIDEIIEKSGLDTGGITAALMSLELIGIVKQVQGKHFMLIESLDVLKKEQ